MAKPKIKCGVVGVGSLGQHHARIYASLPGAGLAGISCYKFEPIRSSLTILTSRAAWSAQ